MSTFLDCVKRELKDRKVSKATREHYIERYEGFVRDFAAQGHPLPDNAAAGRMLNELDFQIASRKAIKLDSLQKYARIRNDISGFNRNIRRFKSGTEASIDFSKGARALIEGDPRSGYLSLDAHTDAARSQLYGIFGEVVTKVSKGFLGRQRGKTTLNSFVQELDAPGSTRNRAAQEVAAGWKAVTEAVPKLMRQAGGAMNEIKGPFLPDPTSRGTMMRKGRAAYVRDNLELVDWQRTRWPDGTEVTPEQRVGFLEEVYETKVAQGVNKLSSKQNGLGKGVADLLDEHRLVFYKPKDWQRVLREYGDGDVFESLVSYIDDMAHRIALASRFGYHPRAMFRTVRTIVEKEAQQFDTAQRAATGGAPETQSALGVTKAKFERVVEPMFDVATRANPMDPDTVFGNTVVSTANVLTSAMLGSAFLVSFLGDMATALSRAWNGQRAFGGMGHYLKAFVTGQNEAERISLRTGFIMDEMLSLNSTLQRFTAMSTYGPAWSRRVSDVVLRASMLTPHTKAARYAMKMETAGLLRETMGTRYSEHPMREVFKRYGIEEADWDAFRKNVAPWSPARSPRSEFLLPIDLLQTKLSNKQRLYEKFQGMILTESKNFVLDARIEGGVILRNRLKPDTVIGALAYSFAMYKSFPMSVFLAYGRMSLAMPHRGDRLKMLGALGAAMTMAGAAGVQMREISSGRDPMAMDDPAFWGKAVLSGGALGSLGDFIFSGVNQYGSGPEEVVAGPLVLFAGDSIQLGVDGFEWVAHLGGMADKPDTPFLADVAKFAERYTPGSNVWWGKLAAERALFEPLIMLADPDAYRKMQRQRARRVAEFGNDYFSAPGESLLDMRAPSFDEVF